MPLFPRPWPVPFTTSGEAHSTCNWQSPKLCFVAMLPVLFTVATPSLTSHRASPPLPLCHCDRSLPSNKTMASVGGGPGLTIRGSSFGGGISPCSAAKIGRVNWNKREVSARKRKLVVFIKGVHIKTSNRFAMRIRS